MIFIGKINALMNNSLYEGISSELYKELEIKVGNNDIYVLYSELKVMFRMRVKIGLSDSLNNQLSEKMDLDEISL